MGSVMGSVMDYEKQKKYYRRKSVSIRIFRDETGILSDLLIFVYCVGTDNIYVYDYIRYKRKTLAIDNICEHMTNIGLTDDIVIEKTKKLLESQPNLSHREIAKFTGINKDRVIRFYMMVKRDIYYNDKNI